MRFVRARNDERPFEPGRPTLHLGDGRDYDLDATKSMRTRASEWAKARGFPISDGVVLVEDEGMTACIPLVKMVPGTAVVRATAPLPLEVDVTLEPKSWTQRLPLLGADAPLATGDVAFDGKWMVEASDVDLGRRLLDDERRQVLRALPCWARVTYRNGEIEVLLDSADMAGVHLLAGVDVALELASARLLIGGAYR